MSNRSATSSRFGSLARRAAVGTVAVGVLSLGAVGLSGTAGAAPTVPKVGAHFNCANADKVLTRIQAGEARIAAGLSPIKRWGEPADIGRAVAALASGAFAFSTGDAYHVDGGVHMGRL